MHAEGGAEHTSGEEGDDDFDDKSQGDESTEGGHVAKIASASCGRVGGSPLRSAQPGARKRMGVTHGMPPGHNMWPQSMERLVRTASMGSVAGVSSVGVAEKQGQRNHMEDAVAYIAPFVDGDPTSGFFGVYDGHGGAEVAKLCAGHLHVYAQESMISQQLDGTNGGRSPDVRISSGCSTGPVAGHVTPGRGANMVERALIDAHARLVRDLRRGVQGGSCGSTTACVVIHDHGKKLTVANCGDARAIIVQRVLPVDVDVGVAFRKAHVGEDGQVRCQAVSSGGDGGHDGSKEKGSSDCYINDSFGNISGKSTVDCSNDSSSSSGNIAGLDDETVFAMPLELSAKVQDDLNRPIDVESRLTPVHVVGKRLTVDHKPTLPEEDKRIRAAGGFVTEEGRVNAILAVARSVGDFLLYPFVSAVPTVRTHEIDATRDLAVVICCDGVWDVLSDQDVAELAMMDEDATVAAARIRDAAHACDSGDNITAMVIHMNGAKTAAFIRQIVTDPEKLQSDDYKREQVLLRCGVNDPALVDVKVPPPSSAPRFGRSMETHVRSKQSAHVTSPGVPSLSMGPLIATDQSDSRGIHRGLRDVLASDESGDGEYSADGSGDGGVSGTDDGVPPTPFSTSWPFRCASGGEHDGTGIHRQGGYR